MMLSKFKRDTCVGVISFCSLHTSYGNHRADYDYFKRKSIHINSHGDQAQGYIFGLTVVVESSLCQLYD
jgi:hypothetical protein